MIRTANRRLQWATNPVGFPLKSPESGNIFCLLAGLLELVRDVAVPSHGNDPGGCGEKLMRIRSGVLPHFGRCPFGCSQETVVNQLHGVLDLTVLRPLQHDESAMRTNCYSMETKLGAPKCFGSSGVLGLAPVPTSAGPLRKPGHTNARPTEPRQTHTHTHHKSPQSLQFFYWPAEQASRMPYHSTSTLPAQRRVVTMRPMCSFGFH